MTHVEQVQHRSGEMTLDVREHEVDLVVDARTVAAEGVVVLDLRAFDHKPLPPWSPGAHIDLLLKEDLVRQFSLCGEPADRDIWRIAVLLDPNGRGGSRYIHETLQVGDQVRARGPRNHFQLGPSPKYLFIAGGIGITPLLPMVKAAVAASAEWMMIYGGRQRSSMAFLDQLAQYGSKVTIEARDQGGSIDLQGLLREPRPDTLVYCCGPERLMAGVEAECNRWPTQSLRVERFAPKPMGAPAFAEEFEVELRRTGVTLKVLPQQSILQVVEAAGVQVLCSCCEGTCGSCETPVLEGSPDHRDSVLTDYEKESNRCMMICVSRSRGPRLVLDL